ncbi:MAG: hypothetical protein PWQ67_664 [Clostridia bacterium]|jgi:CDP-diglyceride synthetase|nr:hypothetical protein [Clostridia bacterium]MDN5322210.1 hypothetical protein [Clostridia bacterium]
MFGPYFWLFLIGGFGLITFLIIPSQRILELLSFGIIFGFILGNIILYIGTTLLPLYNINNEIFPFPEWGLSIPIAWLFTVIIFAYYLPKVIDTRLGLYVYIFFWALGTTITYLLLKYLGYWQDISWNLFYNLLLAIFTHTIMAFYLYQTGYIEKYRRNHKPEDNLWDELKSRP